MKCQSLTNHRNPCSFNAAPGGVRCKRHEQMEQAIHEQGKCPYVNICRQRNIYEQCCLATLEDGYCVFHQYDRLNSGLFISNADVQRQHVLDKADGTVPDILQQRYLEKYIRFHSKKGNINNFVTTGVE